MDGIRSWTRAGSIWTTRLQDKMAQMGLGSFGRGAMVAWWKRLLFSFVSMVGAAVVCLGCLVLESALKSHPGSFEAVR